MHCSIAVMLDPSFTSEIYDKESFTFLWRHRDNVINTWHRHIREASVLVVRCTKERDACNLTSQNGG